MIRRSGPIEPAIVLEAVRSSAETRDIRRVPLGGAMVNVASSRLVTFAEKGLACVQCGIEGTVFYAESSRKDDPFPHLNLYAARHDGSEVLMTKDHILARADGGGEGLANLQPMCQPCNMRKGSNAGRRNDVVKARRAPSEGVRRRLTDADLLALTE